MTEETQRLVLELAKKALAELSVRQGGTDLVFMLRDAIRKAEEESRCTR